MQIFKAVVLVFTSILVFAGCDNFGKSDFLQQIEEKEDSAEAFENLLEKNTGDPHVTAKIFTADPDYVVFKNQVTGEYVAYNLKKFDRKNMTDLNQYLAGVTDGKDIVHNLSPEDVYIESGHWEEIWDTFEYTETYYDDACKCDRERTITDKTYVGRNWVDTSYWTTYYKAGGFVFDSAQGMMKDLEILAALDQEKAQKFMANKIKSEFALSDSRSDELAKLTMKYRLLRSSRELTPAEKDIFAEKAFGSDIAQIEKALVEKGLGSEDAYKDFLQKAAETNQTSPETIGKFFDEYVNNGN